MRRLAFVAVAAISISTSVSVWASPAHPQSAVKFKIAALPRLSRLKGFTAGGMNEAGDVVGTATVRGRTVLVVLIGPGSSHSRLFLLPLPKAMTSIVIAGINGSDWVAVTGSPAANQNYPSHQTAFVAMYTGQRYVWTRLPGGHNFDFSASGIAANGDVAGTRSVDGKRSRGVLWRALIPLSAPGPRRYLQPAALGLSKRFPQSETTGIWRAGGHDVVVGDEWKVSAFRSDIAVWTSGFARPALLSTSMVTARPPRAIGGWGSNLYMSGGIMGVDTGEGWFAPIWVSGAGRARPGRFTALSAMGVGGVECFYGASGVSAGPRGGFLGVGSITCIAGRHGSRPLLWRGNSVSNLNDDVLVRSKWRLDDALFVNARQQILATGTFGGHSEVALLTH